MGLDIFIVRKLPGKDKYGDDNTESLEAPSTKYPEHTCNLGYFRSSYNDGGFNRVIEGLLGHGTYDELFQAGDNYDFQPDWAAVAQRARALLGEFDERLAADGGLLKSFHVAIRRKGVASNSGAISVLRKEIAEHREGGLQSYSNRNGEFHLTGLTILAVVPGTNALDELGVWLVYKTPADHYRQSIEILIEACERILAMPAAEQEAIRVHWSG